MEFTSYLLRMSPTELSKQEVMEMLILVSCDVPDGRFILFCVKPGGGQLPWYKDPRVVEGAQWERAESRVLLPKAMLLNREKLFSVVTAADYKTPRCLQCQEFDSQFCSSGNLQW